MRGNIGNFLFAISSAGFFLSRLCVCVCGVLLLLLLLSLDEKRRRKKGLLLVLFWPWGGGKGPWVDLTLDREKEREGRREPPNTRNWTLNLTIFGSFCSPPNLSFFLWNWSVLAQSVLSCKAKLRITTKTKMAKQTRRETESFSLSLLFLTSQTAISISRMRVCRLSLSGEDRESYFHISKKYAEKPDFGTYIYGEWGEAKEKEKLWHRIASNKSPYFPFFSRFR